MQFEMSGHTLSTSETNLLREAFYASCEVLSANGDSRFQGRQGFYARETVKKLVVGYARAGHRNPHDLSQAVIAQMTIL